MNETITISKSEYDDMRMKLGRVQACMSYIMHEEKQHYMVDGEMCLELLGIDIPAEGK